jgi:hypothetical protein
VRTTDDELPSLPGRGRGRVSARGACERRAIIKRIRRTVLL